MDNATRRHPNVVNVSELKAGGFEKGSRFALANRPLGRATGAGEPMVRIMVRQDSGVDYYDGEL